MTTKTVGRHAAESAPSPDQVNVTAVRSDVNALAAYRQAQLAPAPSPATPVSPLRRTWRVIAGTFNAVSVTALVIGVAVNLGIPVYAQMNDQMPTVIVSGSMEPGLMTGTLVLVDETVNVDDLPVGTVITFMPGNDRIPVTHRIVDITRDANNDTFYVTKGDNNNANDPNPVKPVNVIGAFAHDLDDVLELPIVGAVPLGQFSGWASTWTGRLALFGPTLVIFLLGELVAIFSNTFLDPRWWARRHKTSRDQPAM